MTAASSATSTEDLLDAYEPGDPKLYALLEAA